MIKNFQPSNYCNVHFVQECEEMQKGRVTCDIVGYYSPPVALIWVQSVRWFIWRWMIFRLREDEVKNSDDGV